MAKQNNHTRNPACSQPTKPYVPLPTKYKGETQWSTANAPATGTPYYLRLLSYMLLDWAQILKGSGFFWRVPSTGGSCGRLGRGWEGGGGAADSLSRAWEAWRGESVWMLRWLDTLCWELPWLSLRSNCCCGGEKKRENMNRKKKHHNLQSAFKTDCRNWIMWSRQGKKRNMNEWVEGQNDAQLSLHLCQDKNDIGTFNCYFNILTQLSFSLTLSTNTSTDIIT